MNPIDEIASNLREIAANRYGDGAVNQLQHALQCATLAEAEAAPAELVTAALLHDIGHVIDSRYEGAAAAGIDRKHEQTGAAYLARWFGPEVSGPVALHVEAKRFLCAVDADYHDGLSDGSVRSLALQGGRFGGAEAAAFVKRPHAEGAIRLRRWDDLAKNPDATTPDLEHFLSLVAAVLARRPAA